MHMEGSHRRPDGEGLVRYDDVQRKLPRRRQCCKAPAVFAMAVVSTIYGDQSSGKTS